MSSSSSFELNTKKINLPRHREKSPSTPEQPPSTPYIPTTNTSATQQHYNHKTRTTDHHAALSSTSQARYVGAPSTSTRNPHANMQDSFRHHHSSIATNCTNPNPQAHQQPKAAPHHQLPSRHARSQRLPPPRQID